MSDLKPGWSERQYRKAKREIKKWPKWMKANLGVRAAVEKEKELRKKASAQ
jgi:hypothetical protein